MGPLLVAPIRNKVTRFEISTDSKMVLSPLLEFVKVLFDPLHGRDVAPLRRHLHQANRRLSEQEQTKFDDLRRGFLKDWLILKDFQRLFPSIAQKAPNLSDFAFLTFFDLTQDDLKTQI